MVLLLGSQQSDTLSPLPESCNCTKHKMVQIRNQQMIGIIIIHISTHLRVYFNATGGRGQGLSRARGGVARIWHFLEQNISTLSPTSPSIKNNSSSERAVAAIIGIWPLAEGRASADLVMYVCCRYRLFCLTHALIH